MMKLITWIMKLFFGFLFCISCSASLAQTAGEIAYEQVIDLSMAMREAIANNPGAANATLPDRLTYRFSILFNEKAAKKTRAEQQDGLMSVRLSGFAGLDAYFDLRTDSTLDGVSISGKIHYVKDKIGSAAREVSALAETKTIAGYLCKSAQFTDKRGTQITIWYTNALPIRVSPVSQFWIAGTVLGFTAGQLHIEAKSVLFRNVSDAEVVPPQQLDVISAETYRSKIKAPG